MIKSITLTGPELMMCRHLGNVRTLCSRSLHVKDAQMGKQSSWESDEWGVVGEYAFCKLHNIFFDPAPKPYGDESDFIYHGQRFDMKTTILPHGQLIATMKKHEKVDFFALAILTGNTVTFPGHCKASKLYNDTNIKDLGHGNGYVVHQSQLTEWKDDEEGKNNSEGAG